MAQRKHPELKVVFDTSALYTGSASDLFNTKILSLIKDYSRVADLKVTWYLPKVVETEREYQMLEEGKELLPSIHKLEKLLGHNLNITEEIIHEKIKLTIIQQLTTNSISTLNIDISKVNWGKIIHDALYRIPPFEKGEKEKGFRDSLIAESFKQLVESTPKTPQRCRVVFVTGDGLLTDALTEATKTMNNVYIYNDIEELKSLINTLASTVQEELINLIKQKVKNYFFEKGNRDSLYYKEKILEEIEKRYDDKLKELPLYAEIRRNGMRYISAPSFVSKKNQRIYWKSRINIVSKAYKETQKTSYLSSAAGLGKYLEQLEQLEQTDPPSLPWLSSLLKQAKQTNLSMALSKRVEAGLEKEELVAEGRTTFEVTWSVIVTTKHHLRNPQIKSVDFVEINWEDKIK